MAPILPTRHFSKVSLKSYKKWKRFLNEYDRDDIEEAYNMYKDSVVDELQVCESEEDARDCLMMDSTVTEVVFYGGGGVSLIRFLIDKKWYDVAEEMIRDGKMYVDQHSETMKQRLQDLESEVHSLC